MSDLISRAAAIERATKDHDFYKGATTPADMARRDELLNVMCWLGELPSAQPERQKGEWIDYTEDGYVECPFCHNATNCDGNKDELHFCFSCGADMREVSEK